MKRLFLQTTKPTKMSKGSRRKSFSFLIAVHVFVNTGIITFTIP